MEVGLKKIQELENYKFKIPYYQRGYRWGKDEVMALLSDIDDFCNSFADVNDGSFYCLQPVIVKKNSEEKSFNVVDGQQRLTTIFLILNFLDHSTSKERSLFNEDTESFFEIDYETREASREFLKKIRNNLEDENVKNIDFYHFVQAYKTIQSFFNQSKHGTSVHIMKFKEILLGGCRVLWYEIEGDENEVFRRLNTGKIPLSEVENIKALFLVQNDNLSEKDIVDMAEEWYNAECAARANNDFIYGVLKKIKLKQETEKGSGGNNQIKDDTMRIRVFLESICQCNNKSLFDVFYEAYQNNEIQSKWKALRSSIRSLQDFASRGTNDFIKREIFHYLGFLVYSGESIYGLYQKYLELQSKEKYRNFLFIKVRDKVKELTKDTHGKIEELSYQDHRQEILELLLLFNLELLLNDRGSNAYFEFHRFQLEEWSLEHIYAQKAKDVQEIIETTIDQVPSKERQIDRINEWLKDVLEHFQVWIDEDGADNTEEMGEIIRQIQDKCRELDENRSELMRMSNKNFKERLKEMLDALLGAIKEFFKRHPVLNSIQNLALLDRSSNSVLNNKTFAEKCRKVDELGNQNKLVPLATKQVFAKYFTQGDKGNMGIFSPKDQSDYKHTITRTLTKYLETYGEDIDGK